MALFSNLITPVRTPTTPRPTLRVDPARPTSPSVWQGKTLDPYATGAANNGGLLSGLFTSFGQNNGLSSFLQSLMQRNAPVQQTNPAQTTVAPPTNSGLKLSSWTTRNQPSGTTRRWFGR